MRLAYGVIVFGGVIVIVGVRVTIGASAGVNVAGRGSSGGTMRIDWIRINKTAKTAPSSIAFGEYLIGESLY